MRFHVGLAIVPTVLVLSACAPTALYYKSGVTPAKQDRDLTNCQVQALSDVPVNTQTRRTPRRSVPVQRCNAAGECVTYIEYTGGHLVSYDANKPLRKKVAAQCMLDKRYQQISLPRCTPAQLQTLGSTLPAKSPPLTANSCILRSKSGAWVVANPQ